MRTIYSVALFALAASACTVTNEDGEKRPVVGADLVSASGTLGEKSGELQIAVSPRDADGSFVGAGLPESAFSFESVTIGPQGSAAPRAVQASVTGISVVEADESGVQGVVVFDSSGSMSTNDPNATGRLAGGQAIVDTLRPQDEFAILDFGAGRDTQFRASRLLQDFTSDHDSLKAALSSLTESGDTPLYSSLLDALDLLKEKAGTSGTIVVLTDGQASDSGLTTVIDQANAQNVHIYALGLGMNLGFADLTRLGHETGGGSITAKDAQQLRDRFGGIGLGVSAGKVVVHGMATYDTLPAAALYEVTGVLVTNDSDNPIQTPFQFLTARGP